MSGLEPIAIALAGPMGKLAWAGIKKCWAKYRKHRPSMGDDTSGVVGMELDKKGRLIGEIYDRYANKLGAKFVQGDYKARRELLVVNKYREFRVVRNDISRMPNETMSPEAQTQLFFEDLNKASDKVLQALRSLATRIDSMFDVDQVSVVSGDRDHVSMNGLAAALQKINSPLSRALDRRIPLTVTEEDTKYCHGALALQQVSSRSIEDIAIDGQPRMQYTYVCKFCFLQISNYQRLAQTWGPYEWATLAKSHIIACTTWLDSRALFKCIDCEKLGKEHVTIDAEDFIIHTQDHLLNATTGTVPRDSAYFHETYHSRAVSRKRSHKDIMAEMEKEIAAYEKVVEMELAGDPVVQDAKAAAVPLVEEEEDDDDIDKWYHPTPKAEVKKELPQSPKAPHKPRPSSNSTNKSLVSDRESATAPLGPGTAGAPNSPPPYQQAQQSATNEAALQQSLGGKSPLTPVSTHLPEPSKDTRSTEVSFPQNAETDHLQRSSRNPPAKEKAAHTKDATLPSHVRHRQVDAKEQSLLRPAVVTEPEDGLSECPGCGSRMEAEAVFEHLDICPSNTIRQADPTQAYAQTRAPGPERETARHPPSEYMVPRKPTHNINEADTGRPIRSGAAPGPLNGNNNPYQPVNQISGTVPGQAQPSAPTRLPPTPPQQQQAPRPKAIRKITPAEADENYRAQRHSGQTTTPSNGRNSRDLHVRQSSTAADSGDRTPQPPGGYMDWQNYPTYEGWESRQ